MSTQYSFKKGFWKMLLNVLIFVIPMVANMLPQEWQNITLSGALYMLVNYFKVISK